MAYYGHLMVTLRRSNRRSRRRPRSRGQALVEFALVLPIFFLVLSGIMDFGFMLYSRMTVINAAREGARAGINLAPSDRAGIPSIASAAVTSSASGSGISGLNVSTSCVRTAGSCGFTVHTPAQTGDAKAGDSVRVTVTYSYHTFFPLLFGATIPLGSTVQMVLEGT